MLTTPNFALSYPEPADHTRTWEYWQTLATQLDGLLLPGHFYFTTELQTPASAVTVNIPAGVMAVRANLRVRSDAPGTAMLNLYTRINQSAEAMYVYKGLWSLGPDAPGTEFIWGDVAALIGRIPGGTAAAGHFGSAIVDVAGWSATRTAAEHTLTFEAHSSLTFSAPSGIGVWLGAAFYGGAAPYQSLTFFPQAGNFVAGSVVTVEGSPYRAGGAGMAAAEAVLAPAVDPSFEQVAYPPPPGTESSV